MTHTASGECATSAVATALSCSRCVSCTHTDAKPKHQNWCQDACPPSKPWRSRLVRFEPIRPFQVGELAGQKWPVSFNWKLRTLDKGDISTLR